MDLNKFYGRKEVLITGGAGFLGSNLSRELKRLDSKVTIITPPGNNSANLSNMQGIKVIYGDIRKMEDVRKHVRGKEVIFDFAAQIGNSHAPTRSDLGAEIWGHENILKVCKQENPDVRLIYPGSRLEYGNVPNQDLPVSEDYPLNPLSAYAKDKVTVGKLYEQAWREQGLDTLVLRLTNPFGPGAQVKNPGYGIVGWFIRQALEGEEISLFGDGSQGRDYFYVSDAVDAFLLSGAIENPPSRTYNVGSGTLTSLVEMANSIVEIAERGSVKFAPWPDTYKQTETGDFYADTSRIEKDLLWSPRVKIEEGLEQTIKFYRENLNKYVGS